MTNETATPDPVERRSLGAYRRGTMDALREQLQVAAETPFYGRLFDEAGVDPGGVTDPEDLRTLPTIEKDDLRRSQQRAPPFGEHRACDPADVARVYTTSGTTGRPTFVGLTESDLDTWAAAAARAARAAGLGPGDTVVGALPGGPFAGAVTYDGHRATGATIAPVGPGHTDRIVTMFRAGCGTALLGTPSYAEYLVEAVRERGHDPAALGVERMLVGGEPGTNDVRPAVEEAFDCVVTESLGITDVSVSVWGECHRRDGMHFTGQGVAFPELVDPATGDPVAWEAGATGELVYTSLNRECVPVVRFRSRDHVEVVGTDCECGRETPRIRCLGRTDDMFIVRGVNVFPSAVKHVVSDVDGTTGHLRIHLPAGETRVDAPVAITVERSASPSHRGDGTAVDEAGDTEDAEALAARLERTIRDRLDFRPAVDVVPAGTLGRSQYKTDLVERV